MKEAINRIHIKGKTESEKQREKKGVRDCV
jgi:hypothetical protein